MLVVEELLEGVVARWAVPAECGGEGLEVSLPRAAMAGMARL